MTKQTSNLYFKILNSIVDLRNPYRKLIYTQFIEIKSKSYLNNLIFLKANINFLLLLIFRFFDFESMFASKFILPRNFFQHLDIVGIYSIQSF